MWSSYWLEGKLTGDRIRVWVIFCLIISLPQHLAPRRCSRKNYLEVKRKWVSVLKASRTDYHGQFDCRASHWGKPLSTESGPEGVLFPQKILFFQPLILQVVVYTEDCSFLLRNKAGIYLATVCGWRCLIHCHNVPYCSQLISFTYTLVETRFNII